MLSLSSFFAASGLSGETQAIVDALFHALNPPANPLDPGRYWLFWFFCGFSVAFFALTVVLFFVKLLRSQSRIGWLGVSASLLASVWCLRFAVGLYGILVSPEAGLTVWEEIFNSFSHALQTFSMDEDYTEYIINGRTMFAELCGADSLPVTVYGIYASVLNLLAPVAGGALLFEMLASIFPRLRLWSARWNVFSEKIYFSELNEQSLALMKSLQDSGEKKGATYVFTDAYEDKEDEQRSERLAEAKQMGSVCVPDDIAHIVKRGWGKRTYFLIDESEVSNLQTLVDLADESNRYCLKKADVYLFCRGDLYTRIERQVFSALHESPRWDKGKDPLITPVHSYRNLVSNLLVELPLYEPLVAKKGEEEKALNVTILGNGTIGTELFLAVYWMGQILDYKLNINVVSKDSFKEFWEKIDYINPEIRKTVEVVESLSEEDGKDSVKRKDFEARRQAAEAERREFLRWDTDGSNQSTDPYATVSYLPSDVKSGSFWRMDNKDDNERLLNTDYFIVSLGSDEDNVAIAEKIRQRVGEHHVENKEGAQKTVIAYVVYDSDLCDTLNRKKKHYSYDPASPDIYMHAFGSRKEVYSYKNIMMTEHQLLAEGAGAGYAASQAKEASEEVHRYEESDLKNDNNNRDYSYWANLGRAMHLKYKVFSSGMVETSVFADTDEASRSHRTSVEKQCKKYKYYLIAPDNRNGENSPLGGKISDLAWLEHRRWCAFTRVRGFRRTEFHGNYKDVTGSHKHMSLKLHPCLRESYRYSDGNDALDALEKTLERVFKNNDRPHCAFGEFITEDEAVALLGGDPKKAKKILYAKGKKALGNTFVYEDENTVLFFKEEICKAAEKRRKGSAK